MALSGPYTDLTALRLSGMIVNPVPSPVGNRVNPPTGLVYFVDSTSTTPGDGTTPQGPLATLAAAVTKLGNAARSNKGDVIYVMPGHTESVSSADYFSGTLTASYFSIIGLGAGSNRPTFTWTTATSTWLLDTAGVEISNIRMFLAGAHAAGSALTVANPITISAADVRIENCEIWWGFDADQIVGTGILTTAAADDLIFYNNTCYAETAAVPTATFMTLVGADRCQIMYNVIIGATSGTTVGVIRGLTTASTNINVAFNYMANNLALSTIAFSPLAASTGTINQNNFFVNSGILPITAGICPWFDNRVVNTVGKSDALVGTVSS